MNKSNWLLWSSLSLLVILLGLGIYGIVLYNNLYDSKTAGFDETSRQILSQTSITEIEKIEQYNGSKAYHVLFGSNDADEEKLIFYPLEGKEKSLTTIDKSEILTEEEIISRWQSECNSCKLIKVTPALEDDEALWEIAYNDVNDEYVLDYKSIYDGSPVHMYRFKRMFN
ncbi:DUF5590 domain-containing protein [Oceanobacillus polygoni]|uniref:Uncharacterized protein YpmB n=1 Tax=Oceanobacillus polygoni TaxID=1235259 RepID=A0A9X0YWJ5_9BACI|nr:DUF5590 domain-containing protein [Oceanobacillus polygoni]MBP2078301.1 uncharacterized protein YpmB [Oceanobacillus polygoni]